MELVSLSSSNLNNLILEGVRQKITEELKEYLEPYLREMKNEIIKKAVEDTLRSIDKIHTQGSYSD